MQIKQAQVSATHPVFRFVNINVPDMRGTRIEHERYGEGIISKEGISSYEIFFERSGKIEIRKDSDELEIIEEMEGGSGPSIDISAVEEVLMSVLEKYDALNEKVPLGDRWEGGKVMMHPADESLQVKEIPMETFFHKIVMVRDRLRVLEQNINSHEKLNDEDKVNLQQYISRCYGSLTTFNLLFREKDHYFRSK